jgi:DNA-binding CsgD family transcriptional regulator
MDTVTLESVFAAVDTIYEAAFDQQRWPDVVSTMCSLFDGSRACILRFGQDSSDAVQSVHDPELNSLACLEAVVRDPLVQTHLAMPVGAVWQRSAIVDEAAFRKRELWQDWFRPRDMHGQMVCKLATSRTANWFLDINRGPRQQAFADADIDLMKKIMPHMLRAGQICRHMAGTRAASALLDMPFGLLLVDGSQCLLQMNETAEMLLARADGPLRLKGGVVAASDAAFEQALRRLVADACLRRGEIMPGLGGTLPIPTGSDADGGIRFVLSVAPYRGAQAYGLPLERCAAIIVTEVARRTGQSFEEHIRAVFKLTASEARFAADLANGLSVKAASTRNGVTIRTGRTYLDRIFRKTGTHHQGQLVARLKTAYPFGVQPLEQSATYIC